MFQAGSAERESRWVHDTRAKRRTPSARGRSPAGYPERGHSAATAFTKEVTTPPHLLAFLDDAFTFSEARSGGHILAYFIPGEGADVRPGRRRLNWVWYVRADEIELAGALVDKDGKRHHASLPEGLVSSDAVSKLRSRAKREVHSKLAELVAATRDPFMQPPRISKSSIPKDMSHELGGVKRREFRLELAA